MSVDRRFREVHIQGGTRPMTRKGIRSLTSKVLIQSAILLSALLAGVGVATAQSDSASAGPVSVGTPARAPVPTRAEVEEVWSKLLTLISKSEGYVTRQEFENTFSMKFGPAKSLGMNGTFYSVRQGKEWLLTASLIVATDMDDPGHHEASVLNVGFKDFAKGQIASENACIPAAKVFEQMLSKGWKGGDFSNPATAFLHRVGVNGGYHAIIQHSDGCLDAILIGKDSPPVLIKYKR